MGWTLHRGITWHRSERQPQPHCTCRNDQQLQQTLQVQILCGEDVIPNRLHTTSYLNCNGCSCAGCNLLLALSQLRCSGGLFDFSVLQGGVLLGGTFLPRNAEPRGEIRRRTRKRKLSVVIRVWLLPSIWSNVGSYDQRRDGTGHA
jgi:hypothetical protein